MNKKTCRFKLKKGDDVMAVNLNKPDRHVKCICCGNNNEFNLYEFQFQLSKDSGIKTCITLCKHCVFHMADLIAQDTVNRLEAKDD